MSKNRNKGKSAGQQAAERQSTIGNPDVVTEPTAPIEMPTVPYLPDDDNTAGQPVVVTDPQGDFLEKRMQGPVEITFVDSPPPSKIVAFQSPSKIVAFQVIDSGGAPSMDVPKYRLGATTMLAGKARVPVEITESNDGLIVQWQDGSTTKFKNVPMEIEYEKP